MLPSTTPRTSPRISSTSSVSSSASQSPRKLPQQSDQPPGDTAPNKPLTGMVRTRKLVATTLDNALPDGATVKIARTGALHSSGQLTRSPALHTSAPLEPSGSLIGPSIGPSTGLTTSSPKTARRKSTRASADSTPRLKGERRKSGATSGRTPLLASPNPTSPTPAKATPVTLITPMPMTLSVGFEPTVRFDDTTIAKIDRKAKPEKAEKAEKPAKRRSKRLSLRLAQTIFGSPGKVQPQPSGARSPDPKDRDDIRVSPELLKLEQSGIEPVALGEATHHEVKSQFASWAASGGTILRGDNAYTRQVRANVKPEFTEAASAMFRKAVDLLMPLFGTEFTLVNGQLQISPQGDAAMANALRQAMATFLDQQQRPGETLKIVNQLREEISAQAEIHADTVDAQTVRLMLAAVVPAVLLRGFSGVVTDTRMAIVKDNAAAWSDKGGSAVDPELLTKVVAELTKQLSKVSNLMNIDSKGGTTDETFAAVDDLIVAMRKQFDEWLQH